MSATSRKRAMRENMAKFSDGKDGGYDRHPAHSWWENIWSLLIMRGELDKEVSSR
jgi:hypothetical protein